MFCIFFAEINVVYVLLAVVEETVHHESVTLVCVLSNVSYGINCSLCSITTNGKDVTVDTTFNISQKNVTSFSQALTLSNLTSGTTYNFCLTTIYTANMTEVGQPVCGNFTTLRTPGIDTACTYTK